MPPSSHPHPRHVLSPAIGLAATIATVGFMAAAIATRRRPHDRTEEGRDALVSYLRDHLTGSDTAFHVVEGIRRSHAGRPEGEFCAWFYEDLREEREVVRDLLTQLGASPLSMKRIGGQAAGAVARAVSGGRREDLSLFRTFEGFAVGVQGKRCMWRALQAVRPLTPLTARRSFEELEAMAVRQWEAIERIRQRLAIAAFAPGGGLRGEASGAQGSRGDTASA